MRSTHNMKQLVSGELDLAPAGKFFIGSVKTEPYTPVQGIASGRFLQGKTNNLHTN